MLETLFFLGFSKFDTKIFRPQLRTTQSEAQLRNINKTQAVARTRGLSLSAQRGMARPFAG